MYLSLLCCCWCFRCTRQLYRWTCHSLSLSLHIVDEYYNRELRETCDPCDICLLLSMFLLLLLLLVFLLSFDIFSWNNITWEREDDKKSRVLVVAAAAYWSGCNIFQWKWENDRNNKQYCCCCHSSYLSATPPTAWVYFFQAGVLFFHREREKYFFEQSWCRPNINTNPAIFVMITHPKYQMFHLM